MKLNKALISLLVTIIICVPTLAATPDWTMPINQEIKNTQDIKHYFKPEEIVEFSFEDNTFTALFSPNKNPNEKGAAILIADWHLTQTNKSGINFLRKSLNQHGWSTYSISAGLPAKNNTSELPDNPDHSIATVLGQYTEAQYEQYVQKLTQRYKAIYQRAQAHKGLIVLITQGQSGAILNNYLADADPEPINALILLNNFLTDPEKNRALNQVVATSQWPILDIYYHNHNYWLARQMPIRKKIARRNQKTDYRQRELLGNQSSQQHHRLNKVIYGYLTWLGL